MKKIEFETFRQLGFYEQNNLKHSEPSAFNGKASFRKYRVTFEEIEESKEILAARVQKLWDECDNMHQFDCIKGAAEELGYELKGSVGSKRKKKR